VKQPPLPRSAQVRHQALEQLSYDCSVRTDLVSWQWQGYPTFHQRGVTLWIHLFAVPAFVASTLAVVFYLATMELVFAGLSFAGMLVAFAAQGIAHKKEPNAPIPFAGAGDFASRLFLEQFVTFPRFVLTGGWWRALRGP
jgi:hypothetical protein